METNYNKLLYEKMQAENETFKDWLLSQEPAEILNHAYEYTIYQDMMLCICTATLLSIPFLLWMGKGCGEKKKHLECDGHDQWSSAGNRTCTKAE